MFKLKSIFKLYLRPYQINVIFHELFTFSGWPGRPGKNKYNEMIYIIKFTLVANYLEDTTTVYG